MVVRPQVIPLRRQPAYSSDAALVQALCDGDPMAKLELFDRYGEHIRRIIVNVIGFDRELEDLVHEAFVRAFGSIRKLSSPEKLKPWLTSIAVFTARGCIRSRSRRKWIPLITAEHSQKLPSGAAPDDVRDAVQCTYSILDALPAHERVVFVLRHIEGMQLAEIAESCDVSIGTIKRRLTRAQRRFLVIARQRPALRPWLEEGKRWTGRK